MDHSLVYKLAIIFVLVHLSRMEASEVFFISVPTSSDNFCSEPCFTLNQLASNSNLHFGTHNVTLFLLPGRHNLSVSLEADNMTHFIMTSLNATAQIECKNFSGISIRNTERVDITNIQFLGCGGNEFTNVNKLVLSDSKFDGLDNSHTALELINTHAVIINCTYIGNTNGSFRNLSVQFESIAAIFGAQGFEVTSSNTWIGSAIIANRSNVSIVSSTFKINRASVGGVLFVQSSSIFIDKTAFMKNGIGERQLLESFSNSFGIGGVFFQEESHVVINNCNFSTNLASVGGIVFALRGSFHAYNSNFTSNTGRYGGTLFTAFAEVVILNCKFDNNEAGFGGVLRSYNSNVTIGESHFDGNNASFGGAILSFNSSIIINESRFSHNKAVVAGSVVVAAGSTIIYYGSIDINQNSAAEFGVYYLSECNVHFFGNATFSSNFGAMLAIYSNITFSGHVVFRNNSQPRAATTVSFQDGGAVSLFQSTAIFDGICRFESNTADNGGAVHSVESVLYVSGTLTLEYNKANGDGGGVYLSQSELNCNPNGILNIFDNVASEKGGGIHAISSTVKSTSSHETNLLFFNNSAREGGGLYLETNAKLYVHKLAPINSGQKAVQFIDNSANYGGAIYVDDNTNSASCTTKSSECFFRVVYNSYIIVAPNIATIYFARNYAHIAGSSLFGGLLDRCIVSPFAKLNIYAINAYRLDISGVSYLSNVSTGINSSSISSLPTQLCRCVNNKPDCKYQQWNPVMIKKGQSFSVKFSAVDQVGHPISATVQSILNFNGSGLAEGQLTRSIEAKCTELTFNIVSPQSREVLSLYASNGPCNDAELSTLLVEISFSPCNCPIGFQTSELNAEINCTCECHNRIKQYMICNPHTELLMKQRPSNVWISYINTTNLSTGYLVFPNCPYGYCTARSLAINLNHLNGADKQCALNRSGLLCGSCQTGLSLSLGSSRCVHCPNYWSVVFVLVTAAALLAGILMVAVLLALNMTVAVGTLNGLIFYVNIVEVNRSVLLPFREQSFITVFVSWLNLELGIDTCYFPGLDAYYKTWIQLGFVAAYMVFLIAFIMIIISSYSTRFTNLIGKKNPVATLSTLVFLSYAKLLELVFKALSFSIIDYPDGSASRVWLPDATVTYLQGKHIILFVTALLFLFIGLVYTICLFSWQWLLRLPSWRIFKWTRNQKFHTFIETYHAPYVHKHRYWTGMLLLIRAVLYFIAAVNVSNDPQVTLVTVIFAVGFVLSYKGFIGRLYRKWPIDILETISYFNLLTLSLFAWYFIDRKESYKPVAYISIIITFILLLVIIVFHLCKYAVMFSKMSNIERRLSKILPCCSGKKTNSKLNSPQHDEFLDMIDRSISNVNYNLALSAQPVEPPTFSVLELNIETSSATNTEITTATMTTSSSCMEFEPTVQNTTEK